MEGELLAWFELASHLHMTVEELKERIGRTEFLEWQEYFQVQKERTTKEHFYLAQIASEVRRSIVKNPEKVKLQEFLLRFATADEIDKIENEEAREHHIQMSKGKWMMAVGFKPEHN